MAIYSEAIKAKLKSGEFRNITNKVEMIIRDSEIEDGICSIFSVGSTGAVFLNEHEPFLMSDLKKGLEKVASPKDLHHHPNNAHSHIHTAVLGSSQTIPIEKGKLLLGTWQSIILANLDTSAREREVIVTVIGD